MEVLSLYREEKEPRRAEVIVSKDTQTVGGRAGREVMLTTYTPTPLLVWEQRQRTHTQAAHALRAVCKGRLALLPVRDPSGRVVRQGFLEERRLDLSFGRQ